MKKRVLITGGSGTIGRAFIRNYYNDFISFLVRLFDLFLFT